MKVTFDSVALHDLGEVSLMAQSVENGGLDLPNKEVHVLTVQVEVWEQTYRLNYGLISAIRESLTKGYATLLIKDDDGTTFVNRPATVVSHSLPEDPNAWGTYQQRISISFKYQVNLTGSTHLAATFQRTGSIAVTDLGLVDNWKPDWKVSRFHSMRDLRESVHESISAGGEYLLDPTIALADQRTALIAKINEWRTALNGVSGTLVYGGFINRVVRVDTFSPEINQAANGIRWSMSFSYTVYPDEANYASAEFHCAKVEDLADTGNAILTISGKISANSKAAAITKLDAIRTAQLAAYGFTTAIIDGRSQDEKQVDCNDGSAFLELSFSEVYRDLADSATRMTVSFVKTGTASSIQLGNVETWAQSYNARRYSELRNLRERSSGGVSASGEFVASKSDPIETRRATLMARAAEWQNEVNGKDGLLVYGNGTGKFFNQVVKVDDLQTKIDKAVTRIKWTITASYTIFPNEAAYAAADYKVAVTTEQETGDTVMSLTGEVAAATETLALAKLALLRAAVLAANAFTATQVLSQQTDKSSLNVDDGETFIKLSFSETYRKRAADILSFKLNISDQIDTASGLTSRTYTGSVTSSGATADAAYAAALAKAVELGDNKSGFRMQGRISRNDRQVRTDNVLEFVTLDFTFEYRIKGTRVYLEFSSAVEEQTFGEKTERVSGFIVAADVATARSLYLTEVRNAYNGLAIRNESTTDARQRVQSGDYASGSTFTPSSGFGEFQTRLDFNFDVFTEKTPGVYSIKYGFKVDLDYVGLTKMVSVSGRFFGGTDMIVAAANGTPGNKLDALLATLLPTGKHIKSERTLDREIYSDALEHKIGLEFSDSYEDVLTSDAQVVTCDLSEEITHSSTRWQPKGLPDGVSIIQNCGTQEGARSISGSVTATTEAVAMAWVKKSHALPFSAAGTTGGGNTPAVRYEQPPRIRRQWKFLPLSDGAGRGSGANSKFLQVDFTFSEILPDFPYVEA